jgi:L-iditol 2-dehydrogenase
VAMNIICTDTQDFNLSMAKKHGARLVLNPLQDNVLAKVRELTGGKGADVVLVVADVPNIIDQASSLIRKRGEVGVVALINERIPIYPLYFVVNEMNLFGVSSYETKDFIKATEMINNGLDLSDFITRKLSLEDSQKALSILSDKQENVVKVIVEVK